MGNIVLVEIKAWWLLIVPFLLMLSLFVIALIMRNSPEEIEEEKKEEKKKKTLTSWITKKDILYWFLIVCLGAIGIFTFQYKNGTEVISHWGFAGTIVSIILAVIAIGFTLFQTLTHSLSSEKIEKSAERIEEASAGLDSTVLIRAGDIITSASQNIAKYNSDVELKLVNLTEELLEIKTSQLESSNKFDTFFTKQEAAAFEGNENGNQNESSPNIDIDHFIDKVYPNLSLMTRFFLYSTLFLKEKDKITIKRNRIKFLREFSDFDFKHRMENEAEAEEVNKIKTKKRYFQGANMGALSTVQTLVRHLGIIRAFNEKDDPSKSALLEKAEVTIPAQFIEFLNEFNKEDD